MDRRTFFGALAALPAAAVAEPVVKPLTTYPSRGGTKSRITHLYYQDGQLVAESSIVWMPCGWDTFIGITE